MPIVTLRFNENEWKILHGFCILSGYQATGKEIKKLLLSLAEKRSKELIEDFLYHNFLKTKKSE